MAIMIFGKPNRSMNVVAMMNWKSAATQVLAAGGAMILVPHAGQVAAAMSLRSRPHFAHCSTDATSLDYNIQQGLQQLTKVTGGGAC
jgi:hypothetical protein